MAVVRTRGLTIGPGENAERENEQEMNRQEGDHEEVRREPGRDRAARAARRHFTAPTVNPAINRSRNRL
jgi:hypothetical protein